MYFRAFCITVYTVNCFFFIFQPEIQAAAASLQHSCLLVFQAAVTPELSYIPLKSNMPEELLQDHCIKYLSAQSDGRKQRFPPYSSGGLCEQGRVAGELIE